MRLGLCAAGVFGVLALGCSSKDAALGLRLAPHEPREAHYDNGQVRERYEVTKDAQGSYVRDGSYLEFYSNGTKASEGAYTQGKRTAIWTSWDDAGKISATRTFVDDLEDGTSVHYAAGQVSMKMDWKRGKADGAWILFRDGKEAVVGKTKNGKTDGVFVLKDATGTKIAEVKLEQGRYLGPVQQVRPRPSSTTAKCPTLTRFVLGQATFADVKLGLLDHGFIPSDGVLGGSKVITASSEALGSDALEKATFVFDGDDRLVAARFVLPNEHRVGSGGGDFRALKQQVEKNYMLNEQRIPFVGDMSARLSSPGCRVLLDAPHLSFKMSADFMLEGQDRALSQL